MRSHSGGGLEEPWTVVLLWIENSKECRSYGTPTERDGAKQRGGIAAVVTAIWSLFGIFVIYLWPGGLRQEFFGIISRGVDLDTG